MKYLKHIFIVVPIIISLLIGYPTGSFSVEKKDKSTKSKSQSTSPSISNSQSSEITKFTAYCCEDGKVIKKIVAKGFFKNRKNEKTCSYSRSKVEKYCGVCCRNGVSSPVSTQNEKITCQKKGLKFYASEKECKPDLFYCCLPKGNIKQLSASQCKRLRGKAYKTRSLAEDNCGWCCRDEKVFSVTSTSQCANKGDSFHQTQTEAKSKCKPATGFCNVKAKTLSRITEKMCDRRKGLFFTKLTLANADLLQKKKKRLAKKQYRINGGKSPDQKDNKKRRDTFRPHPDVKPFLLPDLDVIKTSVNPNCYMKVKVKNIGGPINAADHAAAKIHLSASAGLVSSMTKLIQIDPGGTLRSPGGEITYTTSMRITTLNQATLVWMDTEHAITESDEINNGDDAQLTCKTPLVWCCAKGKVGQIRGKVGRITKDECKKVNGMIHKTEKQANKACGINDQLLPTRPEPLDELKKKEPAKSKGKDRSAMTPFGEMHGTLPPVDTQTEVPEMVPMLFDMGIRIESPTSAHKFYQGETITVRYRFSREAEAGDVSFTAINRGTAIGVASITVPYNPLTDGLDYREVELTFADDVLVGQYFIMASHPVSGAHGESDIFRVELNSAQINFLRPGTGDLFHHPGGAISVSYQFSRRVEPGPITFELYTLESGTPLATMTQTYNPGSAAALFPFIRLFDWPIPSAISSDHCFIVATHSKALGTSNTFAIQPLRVAGDIMATVTTPFDIRFINIRKDDDGQVKAIVAVTGGFFAGEVDFQVRIDDGFATSVRTHISSSHERNEVIIGELVTPASLEEAFDSYSYCGRIFEVTVDPHNHISETDETNNLIRRGVSYWESNGEIYLNYHGVRILPGSTVRIPCGITSSHEAFQIRVRNCGDHSILFGAGNPISSVRQTGRRPRGGGSLGYEDFDDEITPENRGGDRSVAAGDMSELWIPFDRLTLVDGTLTFEVRGGARDRIVDWSGVTTPYTVNLNFGEYFPFEGECRY